MAPKFFEDRPHYYIPIPGTFSWDEDPLVYQWYERGSSFETYLREEHDIHQHPRGYLTWSTALDGVFWKKNMAVWKAAAKHLACHLETVPWQDRNIIAHSHGGQVAIMAAASGLRFRTLITVGTPIRKDVERFADTAAGNIDYWFHICDSHTDLVSILGALFDGRVRIKHRFDQANDVDDICGIGHSKILNDDWAIKLWTERGWAKRIVHMANHVNR